MKKIVLSLFIAFLCKMALSQVPQGLNYQALAGDDSGNPVRNTDLQVKISILSDTVVPVTMWEELHSTVRTNVHGIFSLVVGSGIRQPASSAIKFSEINWTTSQLFIRTQIYYQGAWRSMGSAKLWAVPYSLIAGDLGGAVKKLTVKGETSSMDEALFEVKNKNGQTVFAVYNEGVRIYVDDGAKGVKGGFAIGGFDQTKGKNQDYFTVNRDSVRVYLDTNPEKSAKGGFAIGGFNNAKGMTNDYFVVSPDSIRAYIAPDLGKGAKGGFAIGGFNNAKSTPEEYLRVTRDSIRAYINNNPVKAAKGGFAIGGFSDAKGFGNEYLSVTTDSVKVSKSLLIPRLTMEERDNLPFTPGEALIIFNTTEGCMQIFKNSVWSNIWCFNCAPSFIIQPVDKTICSGENAIFFVSATGTNLSYQWQESSDNGNTWNNISNGGSTPTYTGAKAYTLTLLNVPVEHHNYKYRCVAAGSCLPNVFSNAVTLFVGSNPPVILLQPNDQQISNECAASFTIVSPGHEVLYKWQQSTDGGTSWNNISDGGTGPVISGTNSSTLYLSNIPLEYTNFKYRCVVSNSCGPDASSIAATLLGNTNPVISSQPINKLVYAGQNISFTLTTSGSGFSYQWQESSNGGTSWTNLSDVGNNPAYSGTNTISLKISNASLTLNNYKYRCVVSHFCRATSISEAATLSVPTLLPLTDIEGNSYNTVGLGTQLWMSENLKTITFNDGLPIPLVTDGPAWASLTTASYCWFNNDEIVNKPIYGALYNWYTVNTGKLCPLGWHVPNDADWTTLLDFLTNNGYGYEGSGNDIGKSLAATSGWTFHATAGNVGNDQGSNNRSGFNGLPGGLRDGGLGNFAQFSTYAGWWSTTEYNSTGSYNIIVAFLNSAVFHSATYKKSGFYIRCLKD